MWGRKMSKMPNAERRLAVLLPEMVSRTFSGVSQQDRTGYLLRMGIACNFEGCYKSQV